MDASSTWVAVLVAFFGAVGGAPLFNFLVARVQAKASISQADRDSFDREKAAFYAERDKQREREERESQSLRLENRTYRDAMADMNIRIGRYEGQVEQYRERITELEAEVKRLRAVHE